MYESHRTYWKYRMPCCTGHSARSIPRTPELARTIRAILSYCKDIYLLYQVLYRTTYILHLQSISNPTYTHTDNAYPSTSTDRPLWPDPQVPKRSCSVLFKLDVAMRSRPCRSKFPRSVAYLGQGQEVLDGTTQYYKYIQAVRGCEDDPVLRGTW